MLSTLVLCASSAAQSAQIGADAKAKSTTKIRIDSVQYRPAQWESDQIEEYENEFVNQGGLLYVYFTNVSEQAIDLRFWRFNGKDQSYWRLNHFIAWDRCSSHHLNPGEMGVLEINATHPDFAVGKECSFYWVDRQGKPVAKHKGVLEADPVQMSYIRVGPDLKHFEIHLRYRGDQTLHLDAPRLYGAAIAASNWTQADLNGAGHSIATVQLDQPLQTGALMLVSIPVQEGGAPRLIQAHRNAYIDQFPIGVWSANPETYALLRRMHIDTFVGGGRKADALFQEILPKFDFKVMVHTGPHTDVDRVRDLSGESRVACWMIQDEPDWSIPANIMLHANEDVRRYDKSIPTFITLCRNLKFFEYAPICDIPCQDHYSVTAPSSSKWPKFYGTHLEETAWYTRDLKIASEPKPIWVWTQGIANWGERPKRPVPTPDELAAQLMLNLGRGAKGILWFNYDHAVAEKYPDARDAMRDWGRVLYCAREDCLASEPVEIPVKAPEKLDLAPLLGKETLILCLTNLDYEIHPEAYPFKPQKEVTIQVRPPAWIQPESAFRVGPSGVEALSFEQDAAGIRTRLDEVKVCSLIVLANSREALAHYEDRYAQALAEEHRDFSSPATE